MWEKGGNRAQVWLKYTMNMLSTPACLPGLLAADLLMATFHNGQKVHDFGRFTPILHLCRIHVLNPLYGRQNNGSPKMLTY